MSISELSILNKEPNPKPKIHQAQKRPLILKISPCEKEDT